MPYVGVFMKLFLPLLLISSAFFNLAEARERKLYNASNSTEAILEFDGAVQYASTRKPQEKTIRKVIESQLEHIVGPMSLADYTAVPKGDHIVTDIKPAPNGFSYHYKGTVVVQNGPTTTYDVILPVNPATIYKSSMVGKNLPCTDDHYQSEGDFWYFWSPNKTGCKLKKDVDYFVIKAKLQRISNTKLTYPEYQNLADEKGNITIHVLFGMDETDKDRDPLTSDDTNAYNYNEFRTYLIKNGYKATKWTDAEVSKIAKTKDGQLPFVETISKGKIVYRFFFGPTGIDEDSLAFHWFYKDALENASIMMYEGHSGLGGHLDLESIEENLQTPIKFNTKRYQIFFFDSCTSYRYYNNQYFDRKKTVNDSNGTKKLDIFTNGLATAFSAMPEASAALAIALEKALNYAQSSNGFVSYQTLAKQIDSGNLFGINGDEDNATPTASK